MVGTYLKTASAKRLTLVVGEVLIPSERFFNDDVGSGAGGKEVLASISNEGGFAGEVEAVDYGSVWCEVRGKCGCERIVGVEVGVRDAGFGNALCKTIKSAFALVYDHKCVWGGFVRDCACDREKWCHADVVGNTDDGFWSRRARHGKYARCLAYAYCKWERCCRQRLFKNTR